MQPQMDGSGFQFLFAGLPENVEYYVQAGAAASKHFKFRVVDLPAVKQMQVTYHYPKWTGMQTVSEEHGGRSARAGRHRRGADGDDDQPAERRVLVARRRPAAAADAAGQKAISITARSTWRRMVPTTWPAMDEGQQVRLSEDYFISTSKANPPSIAIEQARRRLSRQPDRRGDGWREGGSGLWTDACEPALLGERRR